MTPPTTAPTMAPTLVDDEVEEPDPAGAEPDPAGADVDDGAALSVVVVVPLLLVGFGLTDEL